MPSWYTPGAQLPETSRPATRPAQPLPGTTPATRPARPSQPETRPVQPPATTRPAQPSTKPSRPDRPGTAPGEGIGNRPNPDRPGMPDRPTTPPTPDRPDRPVPDRPVRTSPNDQFQNDQIQIDLTGPIDQRQEGHLNFAHRGVDRPAIVHRGSPATSTKLASACLPARLAPMVRPWSWAVELVATSHLCRSLAMVALPLVNAGHLFLWLWRNRSVRRRYGHDQQRSIGDNAAIL